MPTYGLLSTGFVRPTFQEIRSEIETKWRAAFGASIDTSESTPDGQVINIFAERESILWEMGETVAGMMDPSKASGAALDALCLMTGTYRAEATYSAVTLTLTGTATTVIGSGSEVSTASTGIKFATLENATLVALTAWAISSAYVVGDRRTANGNAYVCTVAGTSSASGTGPSSVDPAASIVDGAGTLRWRFMGVGAAADDVAASALETGAKVAVSGDITEIETAVAGWSSVINLLDATPGTDRTSDQGLRLLREFELAASGDSPVPAIKRAIKRVDGVTNVTVFYNNTDTTNVDGLPPHSVEVLVQGGVDQEIAEALYRAVAGGIGYHSSGAGAVTASVEDSEGTTHTIKFTRPEEVPIYVTLTIEVSEDFPSDGATQVKDAIVAWGDEQPSGRDARSSIIGAQSFDVGDSVLGVVSCLIDDAPAPASSTTITINLRQRAVYDTSRITVTANEVTP